MSYIVLARKWRPQGFKDVVGQFHVTRILQNALMTGRIAHAYIFAGPRGVGKTSVARILSKAINCEERGKSPEPCNQCHSCRSITTGKSPDVIEIDGASNRGIDSIRSLQETIAYRPLASRFKIYIIDEVHMLTTEAFNALLKTLEEPPPHVRFIFATTEPQKIPPTVVSRCQRFDFRRIAVRDMEAHLSAICREEGYSLPSDVLEAVVSEADGSMRDAETLLEQVVAFQDETLSPDDVLDLLGVVDRKTVFRALEAIFRKNFEECVAVATDIYERGLDCTKFCHRLVDVIHMLVTVIVTQDDSVRKHHIPSDILTVLQKWAENISMPTVQMYYEFLLRGIEQIRRSSQPHLVLEALLLRLANVPNFMMLPELINRLKAHRTEKITEYEEPTTPTSIEPSLHKKTERSESPKDDWQDFLKWVSERDPLLATQLEGSSVDCSHKNTWTVRVLPVYIDVLKQKLNLIQELVIQYFALNSVHILIEVDTHSNHVNRNAHLSNNRMEVERVVMDNPIVKDAIEILGGHIVSIRPTKAPKDVHNQIGEDEDK